MHHATEKAPDMSGNSVEGKDQNTNHYEGEPIMKNATSVPATPDNPVDPPLTATMSKGIDNLLAQMKKYGVTTLGELHAAQTRKSWPRCPRCFGRIEVTPEGSVIAAGSRATPERDIEICSPCGSDEALRQHFDGIIVPVDAWPMTGARGNRAEDALYFWRWEQDQIADALAGGQS